MSRGRNVIPNLFCVYCRIVLVQPISVVDPYGHYVNEPVWNQEAIVYVDLDMSKVPMSRMEFDGVGHYSRPDILNLSVLDN